MQEVLKMSSKGRDRYRATSKVVEGPVTRIQAVKLLDISDRGRSFRIVAAVSPPKGVGG